MRLTITDIEMDAEELRQSNSLSDGLANILRHAIQVKHRSEFTYDEDEGEENE